MAKPHRTVERAATPISSYLLRIVPRQETRRSLHYELHDLVSGEVHRFTSTLALRRFLSSQSAQALIPSSGHPMRRR